jgi:hypothetical protein
MSGSRPLVVLIVFSAMCIFPFCLILASITLPFPIATIVLLQLITSFCIVILDYCNIFPSTLSRRKCSSLNIGIISWYARNALLVATGSLSTSGNVWELLHPHNHHPHSKERFLGIYMLVGCPSNCHMHDNLRWHKLLMN